MSIRSTKLATGEFYHLYNRGNNKNVIFNDEQDYKYFINLLKIMNTEKRAVSRGNILVKNNLENKNSNIDNEEIISIGAYCCMPNHFHILIKQEKDNGVSIFMQKVSTAYVMYYNKKYKHTGGSFEGKFKSKYAGEDTYLKYLFSYIHLNPLKILDKDWKLKTRSSTQKMYDFLIKYQFSSFNEYYTGQYNIVSKKSFPDYFPSKNSFTKEIFSWISIGYY